jgi:hypothetical protein
MKDNSVIHIKVNAIKGSVLETGISEYLKNLSLLRKKRREFYKKGVEKQIKKIERSGL